MVLSGSKRFLRVATCANEKLKEFRNGNRSRIRRGLLGMRRAVERKRRLRGLSASELRGNGRPN